MSCSKNWSAVTWSGPIIKSKGHPVKALRILGLDIGQKRIGVALSDPLGVTAQGLTVIEYENSSAVLDQLAEICREHEVTLIVAGLPLHLDGGRGEAARAAEKFAAAAGERTGLPVEFVDERLTTRAAERTLLAAGMKRKARKKVRDKIAAVLILETFLRSSGCPDDS